MRGRVKWFNNRTGWGFIEQEAEGPDIFVRHDRIDGAGYKTLHEGDLVDYELEASERGPYAVHVTVVTDGTGHRPSRAS